MLFVRLVRQVDVRQSALAAHIAVETEDEIDTHPSWSVGSSEWAYSLPPAWLHAMVVDCSVDIGVVVVVVVFRDASSPWTRSRGPPPKGESARSHVASARRVRKSATGRSVTKSSLDRMDIDRDRLVVDTSNRFATS
jgi:hypothetical protein